MNTKLLIHVVDDDPALRRSLVVLLEASGQSPREYESAEQFLEEADLDQPGCLLLDLRMRGMGGIELLQHLRANGVGISQPASGRGAHVRPKVAGSAWPAEKLTRNIREL